MNIYIEAVKHTIIMEKFDEHWEIFRSNQAYGISDILEYENKTNLYYNLACAYSLSNELESLS